MGVELVDDSYITGDQTFLGIMEMLQQRRYGELDVGEVHSYCVRVLLR